MKIRTSVYRKFAGRAVWAAWPGLLFVGALAGQENSLAASEGQGAWTTKTIELKYLDPEQLRDVFSGQSFVMRANRDLKLLTVTGPAAFLQQVEDTGKRLDVPPPTAANIELTVYLLATAAQAPTAPALPPELAVVAKGLATAANAPGFRLADSQVMRVREGEQGDLTFTDASATAPVLTHVRIQSAVRSIDPKTNLISLNGVRCWFIRPVPPGDATAPAPARTEGDVSANVDVAPQQPVVVASAGLGKPLIVVVRAGITR